MTEVEEKPQPTPTPAPAILSIGRDPTPDDKVRDDVLTDMLSAHNLFPSKEDKDIRERVLQGLQRLSQECCLEIAQSHGISFTEADIQNPYSEVDAMGTDGEGVADSADPAQPQASSASRAAPIEDSPIVDITKGNIAFAKVVTSGSYPLGVYNSGSDIDVTAVCANHVTRDDFFNLMVDKLNECEDAKNVHYIRDAFVPIIDVEFMGISIDLLFIRLKLLYIPDDLNLHDPKMITYYGDKLETVNGKDKDERKDNANNANGPRVAKYLLENVPNLEAFRSALRFIKFWAGQRNLYGNKFGYPGGIAWGILVAKICVHNPTATASMVLDRFFETYSEWDWGNYVSLNEVEREEKFGLTPFNPDRTEHGGAAPFAVVTPMFPALNSTRDVSVSTRYQLVKEFRRARDLLREGGFTGPVLETVCARRNFFGDFRHFVEVCVSGPTPFVDDVTGLVGAKMKRLMEILEHPERFHINYGGYSYPLFSSYVKYAIPFPGCIKASTQSSPQGDAEGMGNEDENGNDVGEAAHSYFIGMVMEKSPLRDPEKVIMVNHYLHHTRFMSEFAKKQGMYRVHLTVTPFSKFRMPENVKEYIEKVETELKEKENGTKEVKEEGENKEQEKRVKQGSGDEIEEPALKKVKVEP